MTKIKKILNANVQNKKTTLEPKKVNFASKIIKDKNKDKKQR
jgi:hypothetical protein